MCIFCALVFACGVLAGYPVAAAAAFSDSSAPVTRIIYTADTLGYIQPCKTCGGSAQGGLARRAAILPRLAAEHPRALVLAGPNELYADREGASPEQSARMTPALCSAFNQMPYAAIYLSPKALSAIRECGLEPPTNGIAVSDFPVTGFFRAGPMVAACVFLPPGTGANGSPGPDQILAARQAAKEASPLADLLVAISPWGIQAENSLAPSLAGDFHIILGGGPGIAVPGQTSGDPAHPGPLWVRSDRRGRAVNVVDIFSLPAPGTAWLDGIHFSSRLVFLDPHLPQDETVLEMLADLKDTE